MSENLKIKPCYKQYNYPYIFLGCYLTFLLSTVCLANRLTVVGGLLEPGGIFVFPLTFCICDIVGEVYGYAYPRLFIWIGILSEFVFALIVISVSHFPFPEYFKFAEAYQIVFDPTLRYVGSGLVALLIGEFANAYLLTKWKVVWQGRLFIVRSLISTAFGQALLTIIVDILNYVDKVSLNNLVWMMLSGYFWKMSFAVILAFPAWMLVRWLKNAEKVDHYDINTNFNPFLLNLQNDVGLASFYDEENVAVTQR